MAKVKKYQLVFEQEFDFDMIGISSHHNDYRLVWSINAELGLKFVRSKEPYLLHSNKKRTAVAAHTMYEYHCEEDQADYYLIKNKEEGHFLIPEKPSVDYFIFVCERDVVDMEKLGENLRNVSSILAIFHFSPEELESTENIVFN